MGQSICSTTGKVRYDSHGDAHNATVGVRTRRGQSDRDGKPLETPYRCPHCDGYHLGRRYNEQVKGSERRRRRGHHRRNSS